MKTIKTARGRTLNMGQLVEQHEKPASAMFLNAKGDIIDSLGDVKVPEKLVKNTYQITQQVLKRLPH